MPKRNAHEVLGIQSGASAATIKAAWRRLARTHHPDLSGNDPVAARRATRLMAEINAAYTELSDPVLRAKSAAAAGDDGGRSTRARPAPEGGGDGTPPADRPGGGPPRPRPGRPVTARLDMSDYYMPRNQTITGRAAVPPGRNAPPPRHEVEREGPRASDPTGPTERGQVLSFRRPPPPPLADSRAVPIEFGKFRGHTLGQIADFEPSYIDWITRTITRDPELLAAARVVRDDLDERGVLRRGPAPSATHEPPGAQTR